jgi:translation initiation factor IF-2
LGFNIRALNPNLRALTHNNNIEIIYHSIIYKLIDDVTARLESMLAPMIELTVTGEAEIVQLFDIAVKGRKTKPIGGCKVFNGVIAMREKCRITRNGKIIFAGMLPHERLLITGRLDTLKHFKDDLDEVRKGSECGLSFADFEDLKVGDLVQSFKEHEIKRKLYQ